MQHTEPVDLDIDEKERWQEDLCNSAKRRDQLLEEQLENFNTVRRNFAVGSVSPILILFVLVCVVLNFRFNYLYYIVTLIFILLLIFFILLVYSFVKPVSTKQMKWVRVCEPSLVKQPNKGLVQCTENSYRTAHCNLIRRINDTRESTYWNALEKSKFWSSFIYALVFSVALVTLLVVMAQTNLFPNITLTLQNSWNGLLFTFSIILLIVSYLAFFFFGYSAAKGLRIPETKHSEMKLSIADYVDYSYPVKIRAGNSSGIMMNVFRKEPKYSLSRDESLESEIQAAGITIDGDKKQRLPDKFHSQKISWSCFFERKGLYQISIDLHSVDRKTNNSKLFFKVFFDVEVVDPFRTAGLAILMPIVTIITSISSLLHKPPTPP